MTNPTLTKPQPNLFTSPKELGISTFAENASSGYAIFNLDLKKLTYYNDALLQILHCESFAVADAFPNPTLLRIQEPNFATLWQAQLQGLKDTDKAKLECTIKSVYGEKIILKWEFWTIASNNHRLCGIKVEDVTAWKKMTQESRMHVKII